MVKLNPFYLDLPECVWEEKIEKAFSYLQDCNLCPRECKVNRLEDEQGFCKNGRYAYVASFNLHFGEEEPLVGSTGSGTIFFAGCNLGCVFCQNYDISHSIATAQAVTEEDLASIMLFLQQKGACNINFVSPSHVVPQILKAIKIARAKGLTIPLVYNTGAYDKVEIIKLLENVIDIYMPDTKFYHSRPSRIYLKAKDYPELAKKAIKEMHRQVGDLILDEHKIARKGLLIRHLLMPGNLAATEKWLEFIAREISPNTYLNIMDQYRPCGEANRFPELCQTISYADYKKAVDLAHQCGLNRLDKKDLARLMFFLNR
ncbi:MAG: radical SAM protein [Desulfonauticus sp.]|nr:radical SAM protein [Desulfonauticus sp.]